jgi:8-oxo-dGTP pyrophosphatase MutT (NUDIX family)
LLPLRDTAAGLQVLMIRRSAELFGGGWWVFPGGSIDDVDRGPLARRLIAGVSDEQRPWISAAVRETAEEVNLFLTDLAVDTVRLRDLEGEALYEALLAEGVRIDGRTIAYLSNWVTPERVAKRFDTRFFVVEVTSDEPLVPDEGEVDAIEWVGPAEMLGRSRDDYPIIFPTIKHLELLSGFERAGDVLAHAAVGPVEPIMPQMRRGPDGEVILLIPGDEGYEDTVVSALEVD